MIENTPLFSHYTRLINEYLTPPCLQQLGSNNPQQARYQEELELHTLEQQKKLVHTDHCSVLCLPEQLAEPFTTCILVVPAALHCAQNERNTRILTVLSHIY